MTGYILFMMFFVSPPAKPGDQVWALHSTTHIELATLEACKKYGLVLQARLAFTQTTTMRGWCINQANGSSTYSVDNPFGPLESKDKDTDPDVYEIPSVRGSAVKQGIRRRP